MTWIARRLIVLALACSVAPAAMAQDALAKRVSLDLKAMAPAEAFKVLGDAVGMRATVDPAVTTPVDILVRNVSARTALTTICESIGCRWTADAAGIAVKPLGGPEVAVRSRVTRETPVKAARPSAAVERVRSALKQPLPAGMRFENATLADVSARLSEALKLTMEVTTTDPALQTITADFSNLTLQAALKSLVDQTGARRVQWRLTFGDTGGEKTPSIAIMFDSVAVKKKVPRNR
jgi:hypothetical protein